MRTMCRNLDSRRKIISLYVFCLLLDGRDRLMFVAHSFGSFVFVFSYLFARTVHAHLNIIDSHRRLRRSARQCTPPATRTYSAHRDNVDMCLYT